MLRAGSVACGLSSVRTLSTSHHSRSRHMSDLQTNTLLMVIIAILLPPLAVFLKKGLGMPLISASS